MRSSKINKFDSVITIFNAIGHLTRSDYKKALKNIHKNLKPGGIYIFDIFNLNFMLNSDNITDLTIDMIAKEKKRTIRKIQYSTVDRKGVLASHTTTIVETDASKRSGKAKDHKLYKYIVFQN